MKKKIKFEKNLKKKLSKVEELENKIQENMAGWQRAKADYENLKKRSQEEKERLAMFANADLLLELLSIVDNFQSAYGNLPKDLEENNWVIGIKYIKEQMEKFLTDHEVEAIKTIGEKFDPELHEAVDNVKSDKKEGTILEEVLKGYKFKNNVLRPARVRVSAGNKNDKD